MPYLDDPSEELVKIHPHVVVTSIRERELWCVREDIDEPEELPHFALQVDLEDLEEMAEGAPRRVRYGLKLELETTEGRIRIAVDARYEVPPEWAQRFSLSLAVEFANHVALMNIFPYMRQSLSDLSMRVLDNRILMPVYERGDVSFPVPASDQSSDEA